MRTATDLLKRFHASKSPVLASGEDGFAGYLDGYNDEVVFRYVASWGLGWEHVSVTVWKKPTIITPNMQPQLVICERTATWEEMCYVKDMFWNETEWVCQYHPAKAEYVNMHPYCLHLWKPAKGFKQLPLTIMVGPKTPEPAKATETDVNEEPRQHA